VGEKARRLMGTALAVMVLVLVTWGCAQFLFVLIAGHNERLQPPPPLDAAGSAVPQMVIFLIACLDESAVIGETVRAALEPRGTLAVVVDDGSDDDTAAVARAAGGERVIVCRRRVPAARQGKGAALNVGYRRLVAEVSERRLDPSTVLVAVMDADGRLSPGAITDVARRFADPQVGGLQLPVRIRNRTNLLTRLQDFEFWGVSAVAQIARMRTGSVSLGGNGQFTRLSALIGLHGDPWSTSLTEDLDLTVSLLAQGWRTTSSPDAWVSQQGVEQLGRLVRQRTRWFQGHIGCARRIAELWRSNRLSNVAFVEIVAYLLSPVLLVLPWSILFTWGLVVVAGSVLGIGHSPMATDAPTTRLAFLGLWYVVSFAPNLVGAQVYRRRASVSRRQSLLLAHLLIVFNYVTFLAAWKAVARTALGRKGWSKTVRSLEPAEQAGGALDLQEALDAT
jgi:1,2-diacylglycerol 3-beta-glucosyltransferase